MSSYFWLLALFFFTGSEINGTDSIDSSTSSSLVSSSTNFEFSSLDVSLISSTFKFSLFDNLVSSVAS